MINNNPPPLLLRLALWAGAAYFCCMAVAHFFGLKYGSSAESVGEFGVLERCSAACREFQDSPAGILRGGRAAGISQRGSPDLGLLCMGVNAAARGEVDVGTGGGCCWCSTGFPAAEQHREHRAALSGRDAVV